MNKKIAIVCLVVFIVFLGIGGIYLLAAKKDSKTNTPPSSQEQTIGKLTAADIGLKLVMGSNNRKVRVVVEKAGDIKSLDYEITYDADIPASELAPGGEGSKVERGFNGEGKLLGNQSRYESKEFDLGSCSRNVCRYDTGVEEVRIIMKVIKRDGKIYEVKDSIKL